MALDRLHALSTISPKRKLPGSGVRPNRMPLIPLKINSPPPHYLHIQMPPKKCEQKQILVILPQEQYSQLKVMTVNRGLVPFYLILSHPLSRITPFITKNFWLLLGYLKNGITILLGKLTLRFGQITRISSTGKNHRHSLIIRLSGMSCSRNLTTPWSINLVLVIDMPIHYLNDLIMEMQQKTTIKISLFFPKPYL